jgi:tRNA nucleotidyltransferase (CCA-adding enzyme)
LTKTKNSESRALELPAGHPALRIARAVAEAGGRALVVGGWVRDRLLGAVGGDLDLEVHALSREALIERLSTFGEVIQVGRSFDVLRVKGIDLDISLEESDPGDYARASRRRDLTVNSIAWDPLRGEILDPHHGREDLRRRVLRATDADRFGEDPLRGLRVARLSACLEMRPDSELCRLCSGLDLSTTAGERIFEELRRLLLWAPQPSVGLRFLGETGLLRFLPELAEMVGVPQDPQWHPEGDVWGHTLLVVDRAAELRGGEEREDLAMMWGALCHDLGKPAVTSQEAGRVRSQGHDVAGVEASARMLARLRAPAALIAAVEVLVRHHQAPALYVREDASPRAYRRLARRLEAAGVSLELLERVARADRLGRANREARARQFPAGDAFLERARLLAVESAAEPPVVMGRHLLARGYRPGPEVGRILARCREVQDESGSRDPEQILDQVLGTGREPCDRG